MEQPTAPKTYRVGIICGSQRIVRAGPQITTFIQDTVAAHLAASATTPTSITLHPIDILALSLPLTDESGIPSQIRSAADYDHPATRAWSELASSLAAFVFVTPQYNWGVPAGLKNAIDHLYHEWRGKPALVVTYGGHGGDKCAAALEVVLGGGLGMRVVRAAVCLAFPGREFLVRAAKGQELGLDAGKEEGPWSERREEVVRGWEELVRLMVDESGGE